jgi:hypothetical protein
MSWKSVATWKIWSAVICAGFLLAASGCSKRSSGPALVVEIPSGFSGDFLLEMGIKDAPALDKQGNAYVVTVPKSGKVTTSTLLTNARPTFRNSSDGGVWGYSHSVFTTGDGIPTGGKIEFFVGTRKEYDAEESKKNHSGGAAIPLESITAGL